MTQHADSSFFGCWTRSLKNNLGNLRRDWMPRCKKGRPKCLDYEVWVPKDGSRCPKCHVFAKSRIFAILWGLMQSLHYIFELKASFFLFNTQRERDKDGDKENQRERERAQSKSVMEALISRALF